MCRRLLLFLGFGGAMSAVIVSAPVRLAGSDPVEIQVYPSACHSPCAVRVTVRTLPDPALRALTIELDSASFFRSSVIDLDGAESPRAHVIDYRALPAGTYEIRAVLTRDRQDRSVDRIALRVMGLGAGT